MSRRLVAISSRRVAISPQRLRLIGSEFMGGVVYTRYACISAPTSFWSVTTCAQDLGTMLAMQPPEVLDGGDVPGAWTELMSARRAES